MDRIDKILVAQNFGSRKEVHKLIKSKAAYTLTRAGIKDKSLKGLYANLNTFVASSIDLIKTEADYKVFSSLFEAAYGFYYQMANEKGIKNVDK